MSAPMRPPRQIVARSIPLALPFAVLLTLLQPAFPAIESRII